MQLIKEIGENMNKKKELKLKINNEMQKADILEKNTGIMYKIIILSIIGLFAYAINYSKYNTEYSQNKVNYVNQKFIYELNFMQNAIFNAPTKDIKTTNINNYNIHAEKWTDFNISISEGNDKINESFNSMLVGHFIITIVFILMLINSLRKIQLIEREIHLLQSKLMESSVK